MNASASNDPVTTTPENNISSPLMDPQTKVVRMLGMGSVGVIGAYLINVIASIYLGAPSVSSIFLGGANLYTYVTALLCAVCVGGTLVYVNTTTHITLRQDANKLSALTNFIIRAAFWAVLLVGFVDAAISFLRVEGFLISIVGEQITTELGRSRFRGPYIHIPLLLLSVVIASRTRTLGFHWLALLVVGAEMLIVISRFVFSYEQAFQGDLVRFWYGALFLFASAYTLYDDGHVRVDVVFANLDPRKKGLVNAVGAVTLGLSLSWVILYFGLADQSSIINSAVLNYEVSQSGFGMYVKYLMAGFLGVFAVTMGIQFASLFMEGIADWRGDPGKRETGPGGAH